MFVIKLYRLRTLNSIKNVIAGRSSHVFKLPANLIVQESLINFMERKVLLIGSVVFNLLFKLVLFNFDLV